MKFSLRHRAARHLVWVAEGWGQGALTSLAFLAAQTERISQGSAIAQLGARTPAMLALRGRRP